MPKLRQEVGRKTYRIKYLYKRASYASLSFESTPFYGAKVLEMIMVISYKSALALRLVS